MAGLTSRNYQRAVHSVLSGYGIEKSSVSREFVQASAAQLKELCEKKLSDLDLVAILIDGIHFGKQVLVVALGIQTSGEKEVLGLWQGATENTTVVKELLEDLVARGLDPERRYLFVIDGAKALRAGIERVFGERAEVQRCQIHKRRNVKDHLPKNAQGDYDRRIRNAYAMAEYAAAKAELEKIFRQLERINPSAARSLEEGLEETLTVHRLSYFHSFVASRAAGSACCDLRNSTEYAPGVVVTVPKNALRAFSNESSAIGFASFISVF